MKYLMALTYSYWRSYMNEKVSIQHLKELYPIFFQVDEQFHEFECLTSVSVKDRFFEAVARNAHKITKIIFCYKIRYTNE